MRVIGLDISLTSTGIASIDDDGLTAWTFTPKTSGLARLRSIRAEIQHWARPADLVVLEGPSYSSHTGKAHERAGLWWLVYERLESNRVPVAIAPPSNVKKYATGKGGASKDAVLVAAAKRFTQWSGGNDEADAAWLAAMGADHLGFPIAVMPVLHREALAKVAWPVVMGES